MTPADEDTNSILTDKVNRTIQGNVALQVTVVYTLHKPSADTPTMKIKFGQDRLARINMEMFMIW